MRMPDWYALRRIMRDHPDAMVHECAADVLRRLRIDAQVTDSELLWIIESYERSRPKVVSASVADGITVREALG